MPITKRSLVLSLTTFTLALLGGQPGAPLPGQSPLSSSFIRDSSAQPGPHCADRRGPFAWNCAGPIPGMACIQISEPADPHTWQDNFFCSNNDFGIRWSFQGPIPGMRCTQITEPAEPPRHTWHDNFLCVPRQSPFEFSWSYAGPIPGLRCLRFNEPADPHTWHDNFLCWSHSQFGYEQPPPPPPPPPPPVGCLDRRGPFAWNCAGPIPGMACIQINEPADPHTWQDNFFCSNRDLGIRWSFRGPIPGMRCTQITEGAEPPQHTWHDNFLCVPPESPLELAWSARGPIPGLHCLRFHEPSDPHTWNDNFLCWTRAF